MDGPWESIDVIGLMTMRGVMLCASQTFLAQKDVVYEWTADWRKEVASVRGWEWSVLVWWCVEDAGVIWASLESGEEELVGRSLRFECRLFPEDDFSKTLNWKMVNGLKDVAM